MHLASQPETSRKLVAWLLRHGRLLWALALLAAVPATWRTAGLYANLQSEMEELLPPEADSVRALHELRQRMPGLQFLGVLADVGANPPPERLAAAQRLIDDLAARVRAYPPTLVGGVRVGFAAERAFVEKHALLLLERADFDEIRDRVEERLRYEYGKRAGILIDDSEPPPTLDFSDLEKRYRNQAKWGHLAGDRFTSPSLGMSLLLIETSGFSTSARQAKALRERVRSDLAALGGPAAYAPGLRVGFTGDVAISAEETEALMQDLTVSSVLVVAAVALALLLFFRWLPSLFVLLAPLALSTVYAFALASLLGVRVLNSNTAFLGSIIVGNGINFGIILLARYLEERRAGQDVHAALARSLRWTRAGTLAAALAAAVAYGSLIAMDFRGFRQFGVIGGLGMVLAWGSAFVLIPPLVAWLDRKERVAEIFGAAPLARLLLTTRLARFVARFPRAILLVGVACTVLAGLEVRRFSRDRLEYDLSRMRRADTWEHGEGYWGKKMDELLGQYLTPVVMLTSGPDETHAIAQALRAAMKRPPLDAMIDQIRTLDDLLPPDQAERIRDVQRIRKKLTPNVRDNLDPQQLERLERFFGPDAATPITLDEIPEILLKGLRERSGRADSAILVFPKLAAKASLWDGPQNAAFVAALRQLARIPERTGGSAARVAGAPPLAADVVAAMGRDGPIASLLAFAGVVLTVLLFFRGRMATPFVLAALVAGVLWMLALCMALRIKINFINFIAFPITCGIGVDYAVNVLARFVTDGSRDVSGAIRGTGGAVGLCSLTTIIGYSSLLVAKNLGLFSFGFLAVLGEITCLTAALVFLPAALLLWRRRKGKSSTGTTAAAST